MASLSWFHPDVNRQMAEEMVSSKDVGTFLCRRSIIENKYVLTVKSCDDEVTHILIHTVPTRRGSRYRIDKEKFRTLYELLTTYAERPRQLTTKDRKHIYLKQAISSQLITQSKCYFPYLTGDRAEKLLLKEDRPAVYLLRHSWYYPGNIVISVKMSDDEVKHLMIAQKDGKFIFGGKVFNTVDEVIKLLKKKPFYDTDKNRIEIISGLCSQVSYV